MNWARNGVDRSHAVDNLIPSRLNALFTIAGEETQRGGYGLFREAKRREHTLAAAAMSLAAGQPSVEGSVLT
jgi:6-phosphofructokinase 1